MTKILKKTLTILGIIIGLIVVIVIMIMTTLTTPGPFFKEEKLYRSITVYSETPIGKEIDSIMAEVFERLDVVPIYNPDREFNLCFCSTQEKFSFFARLTRRANRIMGFGLLGNFYVNGDFIKELATKTGGRPKYNAREGSVAHVATHELMHGYLSDFLEYFTIKSVPDWKIEGYCEYGVNQFVAPREIGYSIHERIDIYLDNTQWNVTSITHRSHYLWGLMMEFLINVKGLDLQQVVTDGVNNDDVYQEMMNWHEVSKQKSIKK